MSYLVLARKYRPQKFAEVIGQEHITELLGKSISNNRIAHAFLFCGPRGIGKTSCARILAKSLNCQQGPTLDPCGTCPTCKEIAQGSSFDVLEIDGASNRGIDEIRTLRENVKFAPSYGRFKIYIVDEVHMLTMEAFNALLKTLEEPPAHVKFIFATTSVNKVPSTIISRCQRFDFKRMSVQTTMKALEAICKKENFSIDQEALFAIAKASSGSMRDALSILDQLSALSEQNIKAQDVFSMLGLVETQLLFDIVDALGDKNCGKALEVLDHVIDQGKDLKQLSRDLTEHFRHLMVIKVGGKALGRLVDYPSATKDMILKQTEKFSMKEILNAIEILIESQEVSRITESVRLPLEIALARLSYSEQKKSEVLPSRNPVSMNNPSKPSPIPEKNLPSSVNLIKNEKGQIDVAVIPAVEVISNKIEDVVGDLEDVELTLSMIKQAWDALTHAVSREKMSVATYLNEGSPFDLQGTKLVIGLGEGAVFQKESLEQKDTLKLIEKIFSERLRKRIQIQFKIIKDLEHNDDVPMVKNALETFKGKVVNKWHNA